MYIDEMGLAVGLAVLIAWLVVRWRGWRRIAGDDRPPLTEHLRAALRTEWPLLVVLLLPAAATLLYAISPSALLVVVLGLIVWWLGDAVGYLRNGVRPLREPVDCAITGVRGLLRSPWLLGVFAACWGVSAMLARDRLWSWLEHVREYNAAAPVWNRSASYWEEFARGVPQFRQPIGDGGEVVLLLAALVLFSIALLAGDRKYRARAAWPVALTLIGLAAWPASVLLLHDQMAVRLMPAWPRQLAVGLMALGFVWYAPAVALLWHSLLHVLRRRRWELQTVVEGAVRDWPAMLWLLAIVTIPQLLRLALGVAPRVMAYALDQDQVWFFLQLTEAMPTVLTPIIGIALALAAWLIVDRGIGVREALRQSWELARARGVDVLAFALRYSLIFALLGAITAAFPRSAIEHGSGLFGIGFHVATGAIVLIGVVTVGVLSLHLREAPVGAAADLDEVAAYREGDA